MHNFHGAASAEAVVCIGEPGINALAAIRSLGRRDVRVHAVALEGADEIATSSRYCSSVTRLRELPALADTLFEIGRARPSTPLFLFVDNDRMLLALQEEASRLERRFLLPAPLARMAELTDKEFQVRTARAVGIAAPRTWFPGSWDELRRIHERVHARLIAKPWRVLGPEARFKAEVGEPAALIRALRPYALTASDLLLQEYIEGDDHHIYATLAYRSGDGARTSILSVRKLRQTVPGAGVMAVGRVVDRPILRQMTACLMDRLDYRGFLSVEFKECAHTRRVYFVEWNNRPGYFHSIGWRAGFDAAWLGFSDLALRQGPDAHAIRHDAGHAWITGLGELMHLSKIPAAMLRPDYWAPYLGPVEWAVFARDDLAPWVRHAHQLAAWVRARAASRLSPAGARSAARTRA